MLVISVKYNSLAGQADNSFGREGGGSVETKTSNYKENSKY